MYLVFLHVNQNVSQRATVPKAEMTQQNLQTVLAQKQQIEIERAEIDKALEELGKVSDTDAIQTRRLHTCQIYQICINWWSYRAPWAI